jgi:dTDP-glucose 4,6-dehydratase
MKKMLITGGAGFIGSNFIKYMLAHHQEYMLINLDALTYAGNLENLKEIEDNEKYTFVYGDISDKILIKKLFEQYNFDYIINFAAESHVDRSIDDPNIFLKTNIIGTQCLLDAAKAFWQTGNDNTGYPTYLSNVKFIQISTDEVYGSLEQEGFFTETSVIQPNSPYSACKASADLIVRAYYQTYKMPINITRCSNNYGPYQFPEKLIPLMISNALQHNPLPVYGDGMQIRDWLHVYDHCSAIKAVLDHGRDGEVYNIGGNNEKTNIEIVKYVLQQLSKPESLITYVPDRLGHDKHYAIDNSKITTELNWTPSYTFEDGIKLTINWYLHNQQWLQNIQNGEYQNYLQQAETTK